MSISLIQVLSGLGLFFIGVIVGVILNRSIRGEGSKTKRLEQKLAEAQDTHTKYQADVSAHFMETAKLVQTLNKSYRDVHSQLAKGAGKLCDDEQARDFLALGSSADAQETIATPLDKEGEVYTPPMDYAPKEKPDETGTLSEEYGLKEAANNDSTETEEDYKIANQEPPRV